MTQSVKFLVLSALAGVLMCSVATVRADGEDGVPSFKKSTKKEDKEFVSQVGTAIVKAGRSSAKKIEIDKYEYTTPKAGRTELKITMNWQGALVSSNKYVSTIKIKIDSSDKDAWEVLDIEYEDNSKNVIKWNKTKIADLKKPFNK